MSKFHDGQTQTYLQLYTSPEVSNPLRLKRVYYGDNLAIMALILYIVWQFEWKRSTYLQLLHVWYLNITSRISKIILICTGKIYFMVPFCLVLLFGYTKLKMLFIFL